MQNALIVVCLIFYFSYISTDGFCAEHGVTFKTTIIDKFEVAFGHEGETLSLGCTVIVYPTVKKYQPEVVWYRDCKQENSALSFFITVYFLHMY